MKLLNLTTTYFAWLLLILITAWAFIFYYQMLDEIYDSLDDGLENQKMLVIQQAKRNPELLNQVSFEEGYYMMSPVELAQATGFKESYRDTLMYMQNEEDFEPVRLLESVFELDGSYYKIKVITSMVEEDDLIEDLLISICWLYIGLMISILILNNIILQRIWTPFYLLLDKLKHYKLQDNENVSFESSSIEEFDLLNKSLEKFINQARDSYQQQKEFIENASHEMQTPLAIAVNNLERLMESDGIGEDQMKLLEKTMNKLDSLTRYNRSLLLLSKIKNQQFIKSENIEVNTVLRTLIDDFNDLALHKDLCIEFRENAQLSVLMNRELAQILFSNLLKNAIIHSPKNTTIAVILQKGSVVFSNSGKTALVEQEVFSRFKGSPASSYSNGLGLAIAKSIVDTYSFELTYEFKDSHLFTVVLGS